MIGLIGYQDDILGFGLAGFQTMIELQKNSTKEEIKNSIQEIKQKVNVILINESLLNKVRQDKDLKNLLFIEIPENKEKTNLDQIEKLVRDTLGIKF